MRIVIEKREEKGGGLSFLYIADEGEGGRVRKADTKVRGAVKEKKTGGKAHGASREQKRSLRANGEQTRSLLPKTGYEVP